MKNLLALLIITFILSLQFNNGMAQNIENMELADGIHKMELPISDGNKLRCSASFPVLNGEGNVPLILALHYGGEVVPYYGLGYLNILAKPAFDTLIRCYSHFPLRKPGKLPKYYTIWTQVSAIRATDKHSNH